MRTVVLILCWLVVHGAGGAQPQREDSRVLIERARALVEAGQAAQASELLRRAVSLAPASPEAYLGLGVVENLLQHPQAAKQAFRRALELDPANRNARFNLAKLQFEEGAFDAAARDFGRYLAAAPSDPEALLYSLRCAVALRDESTAAKRHAALVRLFPEDLALQAEIACALAPSPFAKLSQQQHRLILSSRAGGTEAAVRFFGLGQCYRRAGDSAKAFGAFNRAVIADPGKLEYRLFLAESLLSEHGSLALDVLRDAVDHFPKSVNAHVALGLAELQVDRLDEALEAYRKAAALDSNSPAALLLLGQIQLARHLAEEAIATFERMSRIAPADARPAFYAGKAWMEVDDGVERAVECFSRAAKLNPADPEAQFWLGSVHFNRKQDYALAVAYLEKALQLAPDMGAAHQMLIQAYRHLGKDARADEQTRRYRETMARVRAQSDFREELEASGLPLGKPGQRSQ